jgi:hypothetical protein
MLKGRCLLVNICARGCCHGVLVGRDEAAAEARQLPVPPAGAGDAPLPDVPLPERGGAATRPQRIRPSLDSDDDLPSTANMTWIHEGRQLSRHGPSVLLMARTCGERTLSTSLLAQ